MIASLEFAPEQGNVLLLSIRVAFLSQHFPSRVVGVRKPHSINFPVSIHGRNSGDRRITTRHGRMTSCPLFKDRDASGTFSLS